MSTQTSPRRANHQDDLLVGLAKSIGATLGTLVAKANAAKEALTPSKPARRRLAKTVKRTKSAGKRLAKGAVAAGKTGVRSSHRTTKKTLRRTKKR
jgi:hypothetical protein